MRSAEIVTAFWEDVWNAHEPDAETGKGGSEYGAAASTQDEPECSEKLAQQLWGHENVLSCGC